MCSVKKPHESKDCYRAQRMTLAEKKESLKKEGCCFLCLKLGHRSHSCKSNAKCVVCFKRHHVHMCPELPSNQETVTSLEGKGEPKITNMSNQSCSRELGIVIDGVPVPRGTLRPRVHITDMGAVVSRGGTDTQQAVPGSARQQSANNLMLAEEDLGGQPNMSDENRAG